MRAFLIVLLLALGVCVRGGLTTSLDAQAPDKEKLNCAGRWALDGQPSGPLETELAKAQSKSVGVLIQGRQVEIEQTDNELKILSGSSVAKIALDGSPSRYVFGGFEYVSTATTDTDKITLVTKRVSNARIQTTQELTMSAGKLVVSTAPPFVVMSGVAPKYIAILEYKKQ